MTPGDLFPLASIEGDRLEGPPPAGFDCARDAQNRFLYDCAWLDQQEAVSTTYLYYVQGFVAAYATVCMHAIVLGTRERPRSIRYKQVAAVHLAQLGVDRRFQGEGLGHRVIADMVGLARESSEFIGCRYLALDAHPDLIGWYAKRGFRINKVMQKQRIEAAAGKHDPADIPVSMRFDLLDPS
jgi:GNAT superfamily N-acetyltransferase